MKKKEQKFEHLLWHLEDGLEDIESYLNITAPIIGLIVQRFNALEKQLDSELCFIISDKSDYFGVLLIHKMGYTQKVDLLDRYSTQMQITLKISNPTFKHFIENLREVGRLRNAVVHADWESTDFEGYTFKNLKLNSKGIVQEYVQFNEDSLKNILNKISGTSFMFDDFREALGDALYSEDGENWRQSHC